MLPDQATPWQLSYKDLFDREDPASVERTGIGILDGLAGLWFMTLHEGVLPDGRRTFSAFSLSWQDGSASVPIHPTAPSSCLAKLRAWVFPPLPAGAKPAADAWKDGCPTAPHSLDGNVLRRIAWLHLRLVACDERDAFYAAAGRLLALCEKLGTAGELLGCEGD